MELSTIKTKTNIFITFDRLQFSVPTKHFRVNEQTNVFKQTYVSKDGRSPLEHMTKNNGSSCIERPYIIHSATCIAQATANPQNTTSLANLEMLFNLNSWTRQ